MSDPDSINQGKAISGFTLIELLVVISIISLLSSVILSSLSGARASARDTRRIQDMEQLMTAVELYRNQHGHVPGDGNGCNADGGKLRDSSWCVVDELKSVMTSIPIDPISDDDFYYAYDVIHLNTSNKCDGENALVIGFNQSETGMDDRETTAGNDQNLDDAAYNRVICK